MQNIMQEVIAPDGVEWGINFSELSSAIDAHNREYQGTFAAVKRAPGTTGLTGVLGESTINTNPAAASKPGRVMDSMEEEEEGS